MANRNSKYKELQSFEEYEESPFTEITGIGEAFLKPRETMLRPVYEDGVIKKVKAGDEEVFAGQRYLGRGQMIDRRQYVKVFMEFIPLVFSDTISAPGVKMLFFIMNLLKPGEEAVMFNSRVAASRLGYKTVKSVHEGLVDLIKLGVIAKSAGLTERYWINHQYIFRGDRTKWIEKKKKNEK